LNGVRQQQRDFTFLRELQYFIYGRIFGFTSTIKYVGVNEIISDTRMKVDQPAEKINRHIRSIRQEPTDIRFVPRC
jgi:hypothetical protein